MLYLQIKEEIKTAMKNKDTEKRDVLKMVVDKAKAIVKEKNPTNVTEDIPDDVILQAIQKEVKQLNQTKDALKGKENTDLYASTTLKIGIEQNRCAMACQGCDAVFLFLNKKQWKPSPNSSIVKSPQPTIKQDRHYHCL